MWKGVTVPLPYAAPKIRSGLVGLICVLIPVHAGKKNHDNSTAWGVPPSEPLSLKNKEQPLHQWFSMIFFITWWILSWQKWARFSPVYSNPVQARTAEQISELYSLVQSFKVLYFFLSLCICQFTWHSLLLCYPGWEVSRTISFHQIAEGWNFAIPASKMHIFFFFLFPQLDK